MRGRERARCVLWGRSLPDNPPNGPAQSAARAQNEYTSMLAEARAEYQDAEENAAAAASTQQQAGASEPLREELVALRAELSNIEAAVPAACWGARSAPRPTRAGTAASIPARPPRPSPRYSRLLRAHRRDAPRHPRPVQHPEESEVAELEGLAAELRGLHERETVLYEGELEQLHTVNELIDEQAEKAASYTCRMLASQRRGMEERMQVGGAAEGRRACG